MTDTPLSGGRLCLRLGLLACMCFGATGPVEACSVPVFRYALERWRPDPYEVLVYFRGELTDEQEAWLDRLNPEYVPGEPFPNAAVSRIDLDGDVRPEFAAIWQEEHADRLPWIVLRTPFKGDNVTVWRGPLNETAVQTILASPMRNEIARRLVEGESIVWVFVDGTDADENAAAFEAAEALLHRLPQEIQLPVIRPEDLRELSVRPEELGLRFSLLRVARDSHAEELLVNSLLSVQPDLKSPALQNLPLLFPVFGRGRAFFPLVGEDIDAEHVEELARFLCGACQCTIKQLNPGVDLLTAIDWDAYVLGTVDDRPLPPLAGLGGFTDVHRSMFAAEGSVAEGRPASSLSPVGDASSPLSTMGASPRSMVDAAEPPTAGAVVDPQLLAGASVAWAAAGLTLLVVVVSLSAAVSRARGGVDQTAPEFGRMPRRGPFSR